MVFNTCGRVWWNWRHLRKHISCLLWGKDATERRFYCYNCSVWFQEGIKFWQKLKFFVHKKTGIVIEEHRAFLKLIDFQLWDLWMASGSLLTVDLENAFGFPPLERWEPFPKLKFPNLTPHRIQNWLSWSLFLPFHCSLLDPVVTGFIIYHLIKRSRKPGFTQDADLVLNSWRKTMAQSSTGASRLIRTWIT